MSSVSRLPVVLVLLVLLAGCQGVTPGGETPTLTPVVVPTETPTERPPQTLAPGVTERGVTDPSALATAHAEALGGTAFTFRANYTERGPDGTVRGRTVTTVRSGAGDRYHYVRSDTDDETVRRVERWSDGERALERQVAGNDTDYRVVRGPDGQPLGPAAALPVDPTARRGIERVFRAVQTTVTVRAVRNGTTYYRVEGDGLTTPNPSSLQDTSLVALVDEHGVVHRYRLAYTTDRGGDEARVVGTVRFTDVGTTTVERPVWAGRVEAN